jgi:cytidyltransferase-like protein
MGQKSSKPVLVVGSFDSVMARELRFLQEAAAFGPVHVQLWSDALTTQLTGETPKCPEAERLYMLDALRYVDRVTLLDQMEGASRMPVVGDVPAAAWIVDPTWDYSDNRSWCRDHGLDYHVIPEDTLQNIPAGASADGTEAPAGLKKVVVTGCYDWFHSGHVRFFEEVSQIGRLYVIVGHDANILLLKGEGHPMFPGTERRYIAGSIKFVHQALVSSGDGWLDAEPELKLIKPDIYAVNEDGDRPEKKEYCAAHGIEYRVLKRTPKDGLPRRQSTDLRGF